MPLLASLHDAELRLLHWIMCEGASPFLDEVAAFSNADDFGIPFIVLLLLVWATRRPGSRRFLHVLLTIVLALGAVHALRAAIWAVAPRARPAWSYPRAEWLVGSSGRLTCASHPDRWIDRSHPPKSPGFPSSHAVTAGVVATAIWLGSKPLGVIAWLYALLVGWGRLYWGKHWPTDVVGGLLLAVGVTYGVYRFLGRWFPPAVPRAVPAVEPPLVGAPLGGPPLGGAPAP